MNKNASIAVAIIVLVLIGGVLIYFMNKGTVDDSTIATTTPTTQNDNTSNTNNNSNSNTVSTTLPQATAPSAVTSSSVSPTQSTAVVNGTVNPKGAFTSYWYEYGTSANLGSKTPTQTMGSGYVAIAAPGYITNLNKNTTYYFRLVAENQYGKVAGGQFTFTTTENTPAPVGSAPTVKTISATSIARTSAIINGEVTPNKAQTQYWFEFGKTASLGNTSAVVSGASDDAKHAVSLSLSGLEPLTTYYFRLNSQNQFGTVNGLILNFKTTGPAASGIVPTVVSQNATAVTANSATFHGTVNPGGLETKYWFEYSTETLVGSTSFSNTSQISAGLSLSSISVKTDVSNLAPKTTYYFRLVAQNSLGTIRGNEIAFKTK